MHFAFFGTFLRINILFTVFEDVLGTFEDWSMLKMFEEGSTQSFRIMGAILKKMRNIEMDI